MTLWEMMKARGHRLLILFACACLLALPARAGLIRDAEVEHTLRQMANPIFHAAGLDPANVRLFIVQSDEINAFVAGGSNIFLHTGLIMASSTPEMLAGVIAHETGHIAGGHLARGMEQLERASLGAIVSYVVGAAAVMAGAGDVGSAVISAGSHASERGFLAYTRSNEQSADQAALTYLATLGMSPRGMLDLFELLRRRERQHFGQPDPYARTHPLSAERIEHVRSYVMQTVELPPPDPLLLQRHERMVGKLEGFLLAPALVLRQYPETDRSVKARYARAVAYFRRADLPRARTEIDRLLAEMPDDPYLLDTKGQILYESGQVEEAAETYRQAVSLAPDAPLIRTAYAQALLALGQPGLTRDATTQLERASLSDPTYGLTWRLLATAYGRQHHPGMARLALAEEAMLAHELKDARDFSRQAMDRLAEGTPSYFRAGDLHALAIRELEKKEGEGKGIFR